MIGVDPWKRGTSYLTTAIHGTSKGDSEADRMRAVACERRWRRYALLGVHGVQRAWQRVKTATETEVAAAPARMQQAHAALTEGRWADALDAMGAVRRPGMDRLRLGYQTEIVTLDGTVVPLTDRYGTPCRRAAWMTDTGAPDWRLPLSRGGTIVRSADREDGGQAWGDDENQCDFNRLTVSESFPRGAAVPTAETPETSGTMPQMAPPTGTPRPAEPSG